MASQEPWDIGAALPVSCPASGAAEQDLFTDRECNHTHTQTRPPSLHFSPTAMSESVSQCVSVVVYLFIYFFTNFFLHKYGSLRREAGETVSLMKRGIGMGWRRRGCGWRGNYARLTHVNLSSVCFLRVLSRAPMSVRLITFP